MCLAALSSGETGRELRPGPIVCNVGGIIMAILGSYGKISPESGVPKMYDKEEEREKDRIRGGRGVERES